MVLAGDTDSKQTFIVSCVYALSSRCLRAWNIALYSQLEYNMSAKRKQYIITEIWQYK